MGNYTLHCRDLTGRDVSARLLGFESLSDALDDLANWADDVIPSPEECAIWSLVSDCGYEVAARRGAV